MSEKWVELIGRVNRMDSKSKLSQVFKDDPRGSRLIGRTKKKTDSTIVYKQILIDAKLEKEIKKQS
jgi:hypothetical protein